MLNIKRHTGTLENCNWYICACWEFWNVGHIINVGMQTTNITDNVSYLKNMTHVNDRHSSILGINTTTDCPPTLATPGHVRSYWLSTHSPWIQPTDIDWLNDIWWEGEVAFTSEVLCEEEGGWVTHVSSSNIVFDERVFRPPIVVVDESKNQLISIEKHKWQM